MPISGDPVNLWRVMRLGLPRNVDAGDFLESFLVAAVAAILGIRVYLELTGYPQLGGHGLHIAHLLWGGLLLTGALLLLLAFLGRRVQRLAAVIGGVGFGTFIDELGKFITSDHNYFFQPTIALIYVIFVLLFLLLRALDHPRRLSREECLANALDLLREAVLDKNNARLKSRALLLLRRGAASPGLESELRQVLEHVEILPSRPPGPARRVVRWGRRTCHRLIAWRWSHRLLVGYLVLYTLLFAVTVVGALAALVTGEAGMADVLGESFDEVGLALASLVASLLALLGVLRLRFSRLSAYQWFKRAVLVEILLTRFFNFYTDQLGAVQWLLLDVAILVVLNYMIRRERDQRDGGTEGEDARASDGLPGHDGHQREPRRRRQADQAKAV